MPVIDLMAIECIDMLTTAIPQRFDLFPDVSDTAWEILVWHHKGQTNKRQRKVLLVFLAFYCFCWFLLTIITSLHFLMLSFKQCLALGLTASDLNTWTNSHSLGAVKCGTCSEFVLRDRQSQITTATPTLWPMSNNGCLSTGQAVAQHNGEVLKYLML